MFRPVRQVAAPGAKSVVSDCIQSIVKVVSAALDLRICIKPLIQTYKFTGVCCCRGLSGVHVFRAPTSLLNQILKTQLCHRPMRVIDARYLAFFANIAIIKFNSARNDIAGAVAGGLTRQLGSKNVSDCRMTSLHEAGHVTRFV